jgi:hypothetical protein
MPKTGPINIKAGTGDINGFVDTQLLCGGVVHFGVSIIDKFVKSQK